MSPHSPHSPHSIAAAIGHTPVVQLRRLTTADSARVCVKLESCNPTGSYKDRMALADSGPKYLAGDLFKPSA